MPETAPPTLLWFRRDLRLADHPGWAAALSGGGPVIPVFILDPETEASLGAAPAWRLERGLAVFGDALDSRGSRLVIRKGPAREVLEALVRETGARRVVWSRLYGEAERARDTAVKSALRAQGVEAESVNAHLLFEPWTVQTKTGGFYRVFTPMWKAVRQLDPGAPHPPPSSLAPPQQWPASETLASLQLAARMRRGRPVLEARVPVGEAWAHNRLRWFLGGPVETYKTDRNRLDLDATSRLSAALSLGEIGPRTLWAAGWEAAEHGPGAAGAETFLSELVWREFAYHLLYHTPEIATRNWRPEWDAFPWQSGSPDADRWCRGLTGIEAVDAGMREMYVTGVMHNRARMIVASYLTKHLLVDWRVGEAWFRECLVDWDPASNALGWQWTAGCGPDAAPYFRIFNPDTQAEKFDPHRRYRDRFIAEGRRTPDPDALAYFAAVPRSWNLDPSAPYPVPPAPLADGRARALAAYDTLRRPAKTV